MEPITVAPADRGRDRFPAGHLIGGRYRVRREIGPDRWATVYQCEEAATGRELALRVFRPELALDAEFVAYVTRRAALTASLAPAREIVAVHACERTEDGRLFVATACGKGDTLREVLQRDQPLAVARAVRLAGQIAEGLGIAHAHGLVHGGLRPENIFVQADGDEETVQLTGWEVAGLETGQVGAAPGQLDLAPGTAEYLAPEQASGEPPTCQSDVYALGVLVYEMLTGFVPFTAPTPEEVLAKHRWDRPVPPRALRADIPAVLQTAVCQALEKRAEHRQQHVRDVANEFLYELALDPDDDEADEDGPLTRLWARLAHRTAPAATSARARWISLALSAALILSAVTALMVTGARREVPTGLGRAGGVSNPVTRSGAAPAAPRVAPPTQPAEPEKPPVVEASAPERPVEPAPQPPQPTINPAEPPATPAEVAPAGTETRSASISKPTRRARPAVVESRKAARRTATRRPPATEPAAAPREPAGEVSRPAGGEAGDGSAIIDWLFKHTR